ncbi:MAG: SDR family NAD(P)-dependent oxidoreductase, partial [Bacteroidota bacterium]
MPPAEAERVMNTNFFGSFHVAQAALPLLRQTGKTRLIFVGSIGGLVAVPYYGVYSASKFAVEGLVESLRLELTQTQVAVTCLEPGDVSTPIIGREYRQPPSEVPEVYREGFQNVMDDMAKGVAEGYPADRVAQRIYQLTTTSRSAPVRKTVGDAVQRLAPVLKRILPHKVVEQIVRSYYRL